MSILTLLAFFSLMVYPCMQGLAQSEEWKIIQEFPNTGIFCGDSRDSLHAVISVLDQGERKSSILFSSDGGNSWDPVHTEPIPDIGTFPITYRNIAYCSDSLIIAIAADSGKYIRSTDGGRTWTSSYFIEKVHLKGLSMYDDRYGAVGMLTNPNRINFTTDGGRSWSPIGLPDSATNGAGIQDVACMGSESIVCLMVTTQSKYFCITSDGGKTWHTTQPIASDRFFHSMFFLNERLGWMVGSGRTIQAPSPSSTIWNTTDGGFTWKSQFDSSNSLQFSEVKFLDSLHGIASGGLMVYRTEDGGDNWYREEVEGVTEDFDLLIIYYGENGGLLASNLSYILRYKRLGAEVPRLIAADDIGLYPNPSTTTSEVRCNIHSSVSGDLNVRIVDAHGDVVRTLNRITVGIGSNDVPIDVSGLSDGVYLIRMDSGTQNLVFKLIMD